MSSYPTGDGNGLLIAQGPGLRFKRRFDIGSTMIYVGFAPNGTADGATGWTIRRITLVGGSPTADEWTDLGAGTWNNRTIEVYT